MRLSNRHAGFALSGGSAARRATRNSTGSVVIAGLINRIFAAMQCSNIPGGLVEVGPIATAAIIYGMLHLEIGGIGHLAIR
jgi:hypothetical protein